MSIPFHHLHGHSFFSNLLQPDALSSPDDLAKRAASVGLSSICVTDHASIAGVPALLKAAKKHGLKGIVGSELYCTTDPAWRPASKEEGRRDYSHVVALAQNQDGFTELCRLLSKASGEPNFYGKPRNAFADLYETKNLIFTTACAGGVLKRGDADCVLRELVAAVGPERVYLEIQPHQDEGQRLVNARAVHLRDQLGLRLVATQDFHYANPGDNVGHEVLLAVGSQDVWSNPERWRYPVDDLYVKSGTEMLQAFAPWIKSGALDKAHVLEAFESTAIIADRLGFELTNRAISLPKMSDDSRKTLLVMAGEALKRKGLAGDERYVKRLVHEMNVLTEAGFLDYFLILADIIAWAKRNGIAVGPGRGSAGGSLLCYLIGITTIDPIRHGLIFERFFRPGRLDLPDIDTDFEDERRDEVLDYIERKYGKDHVCGVASYTMLKPRGAMKDVGRVFEINHVEINQVTGAIKVPDIQVDDPEAEKAHAEEIFADPAVAGFFRKYPVVEPHVRALTGWMRGTGQHAAGVVISGVPVADLCALLRGKDGRRVSCWDKWQIENMGQMKLDILGLRTMTILRHAAEYVLQRTGRRIVYEDLSLDDPRTLELFDKGDTTGVFQCESHGMREVFKGCKVDRFSIIADVISLYRPGPMKEIPKYQQVQTGQIPATYMHPLLQPILEPTFGTLIYQEQMMEVFVQVGGFDFTEADKMRKICGKKLGPAEFAKHAPPFIEGAKRNGLTEQEAEAIFATMAEFGIYSFNKSHAYAYATIAYWTAYMKANFPAEFWAAHLSCTESSEKLKLAMKDVVKAGMQIDWPNVNTSHATRFVPISDVMIAAPLTAIHGVGEKAAELIAGAREGRIDNQGLARGEARQEKKGIVQFDASRTVAGAFTSAQDFANRIYARVVNKRVTDALQSVGAFPWARPHDDVLTAKRRELMKDLAVDVLTVDTGATLLIDNSTVAALQRIFTVLPVFEQETKMKAVYPGMTGKSARIMAILGAPGWQEEKAGTMGQNPAFEKLLDVLRPELSLKPSDFYFTSLYRFRKPPLGFDQWRDRSIELLHHEIDIVKPPLIIAIGSDVTKALMGEDASVMRLHAKTERFKDFPVVFCKSPMLDGVGPDDLRQVSLAISELLV
ncbi:DNA polymerase III subunit alpha [Azospirillum sp. Sh1]|uniref:DNA polymerase III subunit alpha n=1 Tax=Azospirillum sp. Sh1 TaxID=2607285 RepID=UPI0011ED6182|nr:DNA polymerase III subunit alpha [Azospirillum sp. Sh1]KAA0573415.1 DNA polymerase III subunit alpha [Azospirillum sp. Sh1]